MSYEYSSSAKTLIIRGDSYNGSTPTVTYFSIDGDKLKASVHVVKATNTFSDFWPYDHVFDWRTRYSPEEITERDILSIYAMNVPPSFSTRGIPHYDDYALKVSNAVMSGLRIFAGTIKLMTPEQIQQYQHQYVLKNHLNADYDPMSANPDGEACTALHAVELDVLEEELDGCGNPALLYRKIFNDEQTLIPMFIPDGVQTDDRRTEHHNDEPLYIYGIEKFQGFWDNLISYNPSETQDDQTLNRFKPYENRHLIVTAEGAIWERRKWTAILPWRQQEVLIDNVLAELPNATTEQAVTNNK